MVLGSVAWSPERIGLEGSVQSAVNTLAIHRYVSLGLKGRKKAADPTSCFLPLA